eukprot:7472268-Lingulodinium_polyedra.AAC.1
MLSSGGREAGPGRAGRRVGAVRLERGVLPRGDGRVGQRRATGALTPPWVPVAAAQGAPRGAIGPPTVAS